MHLFRTLLAAALILSLSGCYEAEYRQDPSGSEDAYIQISVAAAETAGPKSRADGDQTGEGTSDIEEYKKASDNELFQSLRFIIVDIHNGKKTVEHNVFTEVQGSDHSSITSQPYRVRAQAQKMILLIGNEASLSDDYNKDILDMVRNLKTGDSFPADELLNAQISFPFNKPVAGEGTGTEETVTEENTDAEGNTVKSNQPLYATDQLIPITEFYGFYVGEPLVDSQTNAARPYQATLFATRVATKFTFNLTLGQAYTDKNITPESVTISPIAASEYLLPHNTLYDPAKPYYSPFEIENKVIDDSGQPFVTARTVTQYEVPPAVVTAPFTTAAWTPVENPAPGSPQFTAGPIYLTETGTGIYKSGESPDQKYTVTLNINGISLEAPLPDLKCLPRNTHVIINMTLDKTAEKLECTTIVVPYLGIELKPSFGFD